MPLPSVRRGCLLPFSVDPSDSARPAPPLKQHAKRLVVRRAVEHRPRPVDLVGLAQLVQQQAMQLPPYAASLPIAQPTPAGGRQSLPRHARAAAHLQRQGLPVDPGLEHEQMRPGYRLRRRLGLAKSARSTSIERHPAGAWPYSDLLSDVQVNAWILILLEVLRFIISSCFRRYHGRHAAGDAVFTAVGEEFIGVSIGATIV